MTIQCIAKAAVLQPSRGLPCDSVTINSDPTTIRFNRVQCKLSTNQPDKLQYLIRLPTKHVVVLRMVGPYHSILLANSLSEEADPALLQVGDFTFILKFHLAFISFYVGSIAATRERKSPAKLTKNVAGFLTNPHTTEAVT